MGEPNTEFIGRSHEKHIQSHLKMMRACPQQYLWHKGHPDHDLGAGKEKPKPLPDESKDSEHHQLMGTVLSTVVEEIYDHELYRDPKTIQTKIKEIVEQAFAKAEQRHYVIWSYMTREEAMDICHKGAQNFLEILKEHRFLGPYASRVAYDPTYEQIL